MTTRLAVFSPRGGAGVSTVVANLALALVEAGVETACVDLEGHGALRLHLGLLDPNERADMGRAPEPPKGLRLIESDGSRASEWQDGAVAGQTPARVVLVDVPRTRPDLQAEILASTDAWLCVLPADAMAVAMAPDVKRLLAGTKRAFVLLNHVDPRFALRREAGVFLADVFAARLVGSIRKDEAINEAQANLERLPVFSPHSSAWADFRRLAAAGREIAAGQMPASSALL